MRGDAMKQFELRLILLTFCLSVFLYPGAYVQARRFVRDTAAAVRLAAYDGDEAPAQPPDGTRTPVVFLFDDGWESAYTVAYPIFRRYQAKGSVAVIPSLAGEDGYLSYPQIGALYRDGWDILNHSYSHAEASDDAALLADFQRAGSWLDRRYLTKCENMAVVPYGTCSPYLIRLLLDAGFDSVRTSDSTIVLASDRPSYLPAASLTLLQDEEVDNVKAFLEEARAGGTPALLLLQKVGQVTDPFRMTYAPNRLEAILAYLRDHADRFQVVPYSALFA